MGNRQRVLRETCRVHGARPFVVSVTKGRVGIWVTGHLQVEVGRVTDHLCRWRTFGSKLVTEGPGGPGTRGLSKESVHSTERVTSTDSV